MVRRYLVAPIGQHCLCTVTASLRRLMEPCSLISKQIPAFDYPTVTVLSRGLPLSHDISPAVTWLHVDYHEKQNQALQHRLDMSSVVRNITGNPTPIIFHADDDVPAYSTTPPSLQILEITHSQPLQPSWSRGRTLGGTCCSTRGPYQLSPIAGV